MELKRQMRVYIFLCTFQRIILKFFSSYRSADSSSSFYRLSASSGGGQRSGFRVWPPIGRANDRKLKRAAAAAALWSVAERQFSGGHVFLSFPMCPSLVRASTRGRRPGSAGGRLWTFEKAARARLAKARASQQRSLCRSSIVLSLPPPPSPPPPPPSFHLQRARLRACACLARTSRYTLKHHSGRQLKLAREYSGVKKFGNGDRTDRRLPV